MGIGRREFIRLTSIAFGGLNIDPTQSVFTNKNAYINRKLGISFQKPTDWRYVDIKDFGKLKEEQIFDDIGSQEEWESVKDPICIITKFEESDKYKNVLSPTITVNVLHISELKDLEINSFAELRNNSIIGRSEILKDFKIIKMHDMQVISQCECYGYDSEYLFEHVNFSNPIKVELKVLKIQHGDFFYDINLHEAKIQQQTAEIEFEHFKESIKLI